MSECILFLDDSRWEMFAFVDRLEYDKYNVVFVNSISDAKNQLLNGLKPNLIITDMIMRNDDSQTTDETHHTGIEFCDFIRNNVKLLCPIIVLSVITDQKIITKARQFNITFLNKPISPEELSNRCKEEILKINHKENK